MKSKIFCFNKTIFRKNMTLYWPLWSIYLAGMLICMPFQLWTGVRSYMHNTAAAAEKENLCFYQLSQVLDMRVTMCLVFVMAVVFAMAFFSYLFQARSANTIHALPVTRADLYGTNVLTGLICLIVPLAASFIGCVLLCLSYGISEVQYLAVWFLAMAGIAVAAYGMAVLCVMLTGQMFAVAAYYVIGNFLYVSVRSIVSMIISMIAYGVSYSSVIKTIQIEWLSPIYYIFRLVNFKVDTAWVKDSYMTVTGIQFCGTPIVIGYTVLGIVFFVLSYFFYQKRELERAGDFLTISFVKPIFRWGAAVSLGLLCAYVITEIFESMKIGKMMTVLAVSAVVSGVLFFFLAQMFIKKSFRVFSKKRWIECVFCGLLLLGICNGMKVTAERLENRMADVSDVKRAFLYLDYPVEYGKADLEQLVEIHKDILEEKDEFLDELRQSDDPYSAVEIVYELKDGKKLARSYNLPKNGSGKKMIERLWAIENEPDHFMRQFMCYDYDKAQIKGGIFENYDSFLNYKDRSELSEETAEALFEAVKEDAKEGNLQFYNSYTYLDDNPADKTSYTADLYLEYCPPEGAVYEDIYHRYGSDQEREVQFANGVFYSVSYETESEDGGRGKIPYSYKKDGTWTVSVTFGPECVHTVQALIDNGIITSADELEQKDASLLSDDAEG